MGRERGGIGLESRWEDGRVEEPRMGLVWLATNSCSAHIINFMNSFQPPLRQVLARDFDFLFESFIMAAEGERATRNWYHPRVESGEFILVVEGTVPTAYGGRTCVVGKVGGQDVTAQSLVRRLGGLARWVVAAGTCAAYGGPYAAWPNPTGSRPLSEILARTVINVPGCPVNPGWIHDTLQKLKMGAEMELDPLGRPRFLFGETVHSRCERLSMYERSDFAKKPGDPGCMYFLGCKGPVTHADCPERRWLGQGSGWPVGVNTPCIGCTAPEFPDGMAPFWKHSTDLYGGRARINLEQLGIYTTVFTAAGIGAHLIGQVLTGRLKPEIASLRQSRVARLIRFLRKDR